MKSFDVVLSCLIGTLACFSIFFKEERLFWSLNVDQYNHEVERLQKEVDIYSSEREYLVTKLTEIKQANENDIDRAREASRRLEIKLNKTEMAIKSHDIGLINEPHSDEVIIETEPRISRRRSRIKTLSIMTLLRDATSFGPNRNISDWLNTLSSIDYPKDKMHINILVYYDFTLYYALVDELKHMNMGFNISVYRTEIDEWRRQINVDNARPYEREMEQSKLLAVYRNRMITKYLKHEDYVLWVDSGITSVPLNLLRTWVEFDLDIIAPMHLSTAKPFAELHRFGYPTSCHKDVSNRDKKKEELIILDKAGSLFILVKSEVHRSGINFPIFPVVGSMWEWVGLEGADTDGLCYVATASGFSCWGAPETVEVYVPSFSHYTGEDPWAMA